MRRATLLSPEEAIEQAHRFGVTSDVAGTSLDPMVSTMEIREIDSALPGALSALREGIDSGALPMGRLQTTLRHPEARESDKLWLPKSRHAAWDEPVDIRVAAIRVGEPEEEGRGYLFIVQKKEGAAPRLWACDKTHSWAPERSVNLLIPEAMAILRDLEAHGVGALAAQAQRVELEAQIPPAPRGAKPRV